MSKSKTTTMRSFRVFATMACLFWVASDRPAQRAHGADWPRFRGPNGSGVSTEVGLPVEFGPGKNVVWKVDSGRGMSSPIIAGGRLFFTSFDGDERILHCLEEATGKTLWKRSFTKVRDEPATAPCGPATPTPVSDGSNVFAFFPDVGLVCCSHAGDARWTVDFDPFHGFHGIASSVIVVEGNVILQVDQLNDSFLAAYDAQDGHRVWKVDRLNGTTGGYSTPSMYTTADGRVELVASGPLELAGYDARTGERKWWLNGITNSPISVPLVTGDRLFVCEPYYAANPFKIDALGPYDKNKDGKVSVDELEPGDALRRLIARIDKGWGNGDGAVDSAELEKAFSSFAGGGGLVAVDLGGSGDVSKTHVRWSYQKSVPHVPSVLLYENVLYLINDGGVLVTMDPDSGEILKRGRLRQSGRKYDASPVAADGKVFFLDSDGKMAVVTAGRQWELATTNALEEPCHATPAIANGRLYVRSERALYCFGINRDAADNGPEKNRVHPAKARTES